MDDGSAQDAAQLIVPQRTLNLSINAYVSTSCTSNSNASLQGSATGHVDQHRLQKDIISNSFTTVYDLLVNCSCLVNKPSKSLELSYQQQS
jgi:hypothetical protein